MNLMLFGLVLIVLCFYTPYTVDNTLHVIDVFPDFIGYLILWTALEKRRINKRMRGLYTAVSGMTLLSFLFFLAQIKVFFADFLEGNLMFLRWILDGLTLVWGEYGDLILLIAVLILGWLHFAMLGYWEQDNQHKLHCTVCRAGMALCGISALCHVGATFILLPFSWHWIAYPSSLAAIAAAWFVMKDCQEMLTGTTEFVQERLFGRKK